MRMCKYGDRAFCSLTEEPDALTCNECLSTTPGKYECSSLVPKNRNDVIGHPAHYIEGRKYEPKDVIRDWKLNFNLGSAVKYISRAGRKDNVIQDLQKAIQFIQFEIDAIKEEAENDPK